MATIRLHKMPTATTVRTGSGAIAADNAVINLTNYPLTLGFDPDCRVGKILVFWTGGGTIAPTDWLDLQVLLLDGTSTPAVWVEGQTISGIKQNEAAEFDVAGASFVCVRVVNVSCAAGTGLVVRAAQSDYLT